MTDKIGKFTQTYWPVLVALLIMAAAWGTSTAQIANVSKVQDRIELKIDAMSGQIADTRTAVAGVQTSAGFHEQDIRDLKSRVHSIEARR